MSFEEVLVLYNPNAGKGKAEKHAVKIKKMLREMGVNISLFKSNSIKDTQEYFVNLERNFDLVIIIGGDGTLGPTVDAMLQAGKNFPIYAYGRGTANDFATYFKTQTCAKKFKKLIENPKIEEINLLDIDGSYAISVACGGAFTNGVSHYNQKLKKLFGKVAYYGQAIKTAFKMKPQNIDFVVDGKVYNADTYLFLICNTKYAGGFKYVADLGTHNDDKFDLVAFKKCNLFGQIKILLDIKHKRTHKNKNVLYLQGKDFTVKLNGKVNSNFTKTDIDGNAGGNYPLSVKVADKKIKIVSNL